MMGTALDRGIPPSLHPVLTSMTVATRLHFEFSLERLSRLGRVQQQPSRSKIAKMRMLKPMAITLTLDF